MRTLGSACIAGLIASATPLASASPSTLEQLEHETIGLFDTVSPSVVLIETSEGFGSGFFVSRFGHVLTNRHVVGAHGRVTVRLMDGRQLRGTVVALGKGGVDVALVKISAKRTPALRFASTRSLRIGTWAGSVGHGRGGVWTLNTGLISNAHGDRKRGVLQTQIPLNPGSSGGPVFDRHGNVIGIVASGLVDSNSINFAITPEAAVASLAQLRGLANCLTIHAPKDAAVFVDGTQVGHGPLVTIIAQKQTYRVEVQTSDSRRERSVDFPQQREVTIQ